jgi:hypothetical protein
MAWLLTIKLAINWGLAAWYLRSSPQLAVILIGAGIADAGTLWLCLSMLK